MNRGSDQDHYALLRCTHYRALLPPLPVLPLVIYIFTTVTAAITFFFFFLRRTAAAARAPRARMPHRARTAALRTTRHPIPTTPPCCSRRHLPTYLHRPLYLLPPLPTPYT